MTVTLKPALVSSKPDAGVPSEATTQGMQAGAPFSDSLRQAASGHSREERQSETAADKPGRPARRPGDATGSDAAAAPATSSPTVAEQTAMQTPDASWTGQPTAGSVELNLPQATDAQPALDATQSGAAATFGSAVDGRQQPMTVAVSGLPSDGSLMAASPMAALPMDASPMDASSPLPVSPDGNATSQTISVTQTGASAGGSVSTANGGRDGEASDPILQAIHNVIFRATGDTTVQQSSPALVEHGARSKEASQGNGATAVETSASSNAFSAMDHGAAKAAVAGSDQAQQSMVAAVVPLSPDVPSPGMGSRPAGAANVGATSSKRGSADTKPGAQNFGLASSDGLKNQGAANSGDDAKVIAPDATAGGNGIAQDGTTQPQIVMPVVTAQAEAVAASGSMPVANHQAASGGETKAQSTPQHEALTPLATSAPEAGLALNSVKLMQRVGQSEMTIGMHSSEFGAISIRTSTTRDQVAAEVSLSHEELSKALASHLPEMQARLGGDRALDLRISNTQFTAGDFSQGGSSSGSQGEGNQQRYTRTTADSTVERQGPSDASPLVASIAAMRPESSRLDIRA